MPTEGWNEILQIQQVKLKSKSLLGIESGSRDVMPAVWKTDVASYIFFFQALANRSVQVELVL